eukprot:m51a1_g6660 putative protein fam206a-like (184) ;mRNA; f:161254-161888
MEDDGGDDAPIDLSKIAPGAGFPSFVQRYTSQYYCLSEEEGQRQDQYVYQHHNKLLLVGVAPTHAMLAAASGGVTRVEFAASAANRVIHGKRKTGGLWLEPRTAICEVTTGDGRVHKVRSCVRGHLLEVNDRLAAEPALLGTAAATLGWIAIVKPKYDAQEQCVEHLTTAEAYRAQFPDAPAP